MRFLTAEVRVENPATTCEFHGGISSTGGQFFEFLPFYFANHNPSIAPYPSATLRDST
jgi:hypothetical protein